MQYQIFVQSESASKFVASVVGVPNCVVEGSSKEEAITKAKTALEKKLSRGELVTVEIDAGRTDAEHDPWLKHLGIFADDPTFDDFLEEVAVYRQQADAQEA